jgi:tetratricopeptide (TPR) repeat protein
MWPERHIPRERCSACRCRPHAVLVAVWLAAIGTSSAAADTWDDCRKGAPDAVLAACSSVIEKGERSSDDLAVAHVARGIAYRLKGMLDQSLAELDTALRLNPTLANAFINRGVTRRLKREFDLSLADLDRAVELEPKNPVARAEHGELKPRTIFDTMAQNDAKKRVQALGKRIPCSNSGSASAGETCL